MKPLGLNLSVAGTMRVTYPNPAEDAIWDAVHHAIEQGYDVRRFMSEAKQAWRHELNEATKHAMSEFDREAR